MAIDVDIADPELTPGLDGPVEQGTPETGTHAAVSSRGSAKKDDARGRFDTVLVGFIAATLIVLALAGLVGWQWVHVRDVRQTEQQRALFLGAARQGALNLTTIGYVTIDADIQRILDSSTGSIREDFEKRSKPFIDVVRQSQSTSEGTITAAGLESVDGDSAKALVAVRVKTATAIPTEQEPRAWRMRIAVQRVDSGVKMSSVEFIP